ncbi:unnamed protein product [Paramecium pentaurelia]|uniref:EGF-like domain-containing protein n=1 Tax=Paramecium pentaurelia TaxID=43138 RepID=A0A8S1XC83_9CILI|nr:unnamed protein product [Paramecium pentaurelia]
MILIIKIANKFTTTEMNPNNQFERKIVQLADDNYGTNSCLTYGLWSKYNPLSAIVKVGLQEIFNSHCYHLHNAMDFEQKNLNIVYFDCLNYETNQIIKTVQFINDQNQQMRFDLVIDSFDYENTWYFLQVIIWPKLDKLQLIVTKKQEVLLQTTKEIKTLINDLNLILTFGSNLQVPNSQILEISQLSYFPGPIWLQKVSIQSLEFDFNFIDNLKETYEQNIESCVCNKNEKYKMKDQDFINQQQYQFISQNSNCDSFILIGWIRIKEIKDSFELFSYQLMKVSANLQNPRSQNQNLSPFQLFYHFTPQYNEIEITTYNYTFPDVSIDFLDDPFLLKKKWQIENQITLWHYLKVELLKSKLKVEITFYNEKEINLYNIEYDVYQFHNFQFQIQYGDLQKIFPPYLIVQVRNLEFFNCYNEQIKLSCHFSCQDCDGPTNKDCLSCSQESRRIYLSQHKVCICPYDTIDNENQCQDYKESNIKLIKEEIRYKNKKCKYGQFQYDGDCYQCPSIIKDNFITCYDCVSNPEKWYLYPICQNVFVLKSNINFEETLQPTNDGQFYFDGIQLNQIHYTNISPCDYDLFNQDGIYKEFQLAQIYFREFCQQIYFDLSYQQFCYECLIFNCQICQLNVDSFKCLKCEQHYILIDDNCIYVQEMYKNNQQICLPQYFYSFENQCKLCEIKNCIYCFEYSDLDLNLCSLLNIIQSELLFLSNVKIGCALCEQDYLFDFTLGLCLLQKPKIENCLRSFIDINSKEKCTFSNNDDFSIAPQISNCDKLISNCQQCTIDVEKQIKCVMCQNNYIIENNNCYQNDDFDVNTQLIQNYVNQIQGFLLQFVPSLQLSVYNPFLNPYPISNEPCDLECLSCVDSQCKQCPLNYYKKQVITESSTKCSYCPPLCQVCINRTDEEIQNTSPNFIVNDQNQIYTKKCIFPYRDSPIIYDPYSNFIKYCFNNDCQDKFIFEIIHYSCDYSGFNRYYESNINTQYFNQIGIEKLTVNFTFGISQELCYQFFPLIFQTELKKTIFTLQNVNLQLQSKKYLELILGFTIQFNDFDQIEISNLGLVIDNNYYLLFNNRKNQIHLIIKNFTILNSTINNINSLFVTEVFGNITIINFTILNSIFLNSSIFNFQQQQLLGSIQIASLSIKNCTFIQSALFKFSQIEYFLSFKLFNIFQSNLRNSSIISISNNQPLLGFLFGEELKIKNNSLVHSYFINSTVQITISIKNFDLCFNYLKNSTIIAVSYQISINQIIISENLFVYSQFLFITQITFKNQFICNINNLDIIQNELQTANIILIFSTFQTNSLLIKLINFNIKQNSQYSIEIYIIYLKFN